MELTLNIVAMLGGLALLLFGMDVMGDGLKKSAGSKLKIILGNLTSNPFKGFLLGLVATTIIQSSSATTVMLVGFVNSGAMLLPQAVPIIIGANLGTTITAWIFSTTGIDGAGFLQFLKPDFFSPVLGVIGIVLFMFFKKEKKKNLGLILLGFAVMMFGMDAMSSAMKSIDGLGNIFTTLGDNPILALLAGLAVTAIVQSSSASVGMLQGLALTGHVTFGGAIPIIMGQNIGTCVTAMISSIGATKNAKRTAVIHLCFNVIGAAVYFTLFCLFDWLAPETWFDLGQEISPVGVAIGHTVFQLLTILLFLPFPKLLIKLSYILVKDKKGENEQFSPLEERLLDTPSIAIESSRKATCKMADRSCEVFTDSLNLLDFYDAKVLAEVVVGEAEVDTYEDQLGTYLVKLSSHDMNIADSNEVSKLLHLIGEFERISDHAVHVAKSCEEMFDKKIAFSNEAKAELTVIKNALVEIVTMTRDAFYHNDLTLARQVEPLEQVVDYLKTEMKRRHITRLQKGDCTIELGFVLNDLLTNFERVSDHCSNIAVCIIEISHNSLDTHEYLTHVKSGEQEEFNETYANYLEKYKL